MSERQTWHVNGVDLNVVAVGEGPLVILAHGFPDLALTWRLQIGTLVASGYRVVAPDMRGYGGSDRPAEQSAYSAKEIGKDLLGLLDHEAADKAHVVGHDWGAASIWQFGVDNPDRLLSLTGLSVPYVLPASGPPTELLRRRLGDDFYQVRFQHPEAVAALDSDPERTLATAFNDRFDVIGGGPAMATPPWLPRPVFEAYVETFRRTGFAGGLSYYRNIDENWQAAKRRQNHQIACPSMFVTGSTDPVRDFTRLNSSSAAFKDLRVEVVDGAGHWLHQEQPVVVNRMLLEHLQRADDLGARSEFSV